LLQNSDPVHGGSLGQQKFPVPPRLMFLLRQHRLHPSPQLAQHLELTLENMASGGLRDHLAGGFHRYTVEPSWTVPHFEKMLYDNAQLADLYLEAGVQFEREDFFAVARNTLDFLLAEMRDASGAFYASYDADSEGEEGVFYVWTPEQIQQVLGSQAAQLANAVYGVSKDGNFEGRNVLTRRADLDVLAQDYAVSADDMRQQLDHWRQQLKAAREKRPRPRLDRKIVSSWNALAISAFARAAVVFGERRYLQAAQAASAAIWQLHHQDSGALMRCSTQAHSEASGVLDDYVVFSRALLDVFFASGDVTYLQHCLELEEQVQQRFARPQGGCYLSERSVDAPLGRRFEFVDGVEPSGNAVYLDLLERLYALTGRDAYHRRAEACVGAVSELLHRIGAEMPAWLDGIQRFKSGLKLVCIVGDDEVAGDMLIATQRLLLADVLVVALSSSAASAALVELCPPLDGKISADGKSRAFVCHQGTCLAPADDVAGLLDALKRAADNERFGN
jgi:hypothetical protein